jgi:hypothetical protein
MQSTSFQNTINTSGLKNVQRSSIPTIREISDQDLANYLYTGINVIIPTPLVKVSSKSLFAVNIDGFIPPYNCGSATANASSVTPYSSILSNLFPVQLTRNGLLAGLKITFEQI